MGCCKSAQSADAEKPVLSPPIDPIRFGKPQSQVYNVENFVVVWLDAAIGNNTDTQNSIDHLQKWVNTVNIFIDSDECRAYMYTIKDEKIFLIVSGAMGEQFIPTIQDLPQLDSIYVLCSDKKKHEQWASQFPDVHGIYTAIEPLCEQLGEDMKKSDHDLVGFEIIERSAATRITRENANEQDAHFMYDQLFREIVLSTKEEDVKDMCSFGQTKYKGNKEVLDTLEELETTYYNHTPVWWYTLETFLYRMLNKALHDHNYETLYKLRVFMRQLHEQIVEFQENSIPKSIELYRGQGMKKDKFERIRASEGGLITFPCFLSTSIKHDVALEFAQRSLKDRKKVSVFMTIQVNQGSSIPFADITSLSAIKKEKEWLFSMGSVFRIGSMKQRPDRIWSLHLTLTDEKDEQLAALRKNLKKSMEYNNIFFNFAKLMTRLAAWERAEHFYLKSLETETTSQRRAVIFNDLGSVKTELGKYDEALQNYQQSLDINEKQLTGKNIMDIASTYNNIGTLYYKQKKLDLAIENFLKAMALFKSSSRDDEEFIATIYNNMANVLNDQGKHEDALEYSRKCLAKQLQHPLPTIHPSIALTYGNIAGTLHSLRDFEQAVEYAERAVDIDRKALKPNHPQTQMHMQNLEVIKRSLTNSRR